MKYMRDDLRQEYQRWVGLYPDIEELQYPLMNVSDILRAYFILADYFSDPTAPEQSESMLVGIRDMNLMISAIGRQAASFGGKAKYTQPLEICATLFFGLVKNHAFSDGNKRTALLTLLYQLDCYGFRPLATQKQFERLVVAVAANQLNEAYRKEWRHSNLKDATDRSVEIITRLLKQMTKRKSGAFHLDITARDFIQAFNEIPDCTCEVDGQKIKLRREVKKKIWFSRGSDNIKTFAIPFRGETRSIGAGTVREVLDALDLYDQYADYKGFFEGADPRYMLIQQFEGPLRRLKDK